MGHNYQTDSLSSLDLVGFSEIESELREENAELCAENARLLATLAEYMATPDDGVEVDAPPMQLRPELQPCDHPTACIGPDATERGGQWDYEMAMTLYDEQQKRACEAEAEVVRLREALELAEQCATNGDGQCLNCGKFLSSGHKDECYFQAISTPADDWLERKLEDGRRWSKAWKACARHWRDVCYPYTNLCPVSGCPLYPTDNWLVEQHDEEVRREERERIAQLVEGKGYASWHFNYSSAIAAAIRESTG